MSARARLLLGGVAGLAFLQPAQAEPPADPSSIWTIQDENASISSASLTDRYYVNGARIGWTSPTGLVPDAISSLGYAIWGYGQQRVSVDVTQKIFTPADTQAKPPPPDDEPYAASLTATGSLLQDTDFSRSLLGVSLGVIGPPAGGEEIQNGFHHLIGQSTNKGWNYQLHTEPELQLLADRTWRIPIGQIGWGLETDALPEVQAQAGTALDYAMAGINFRIGSGLRSDFGVARVTPGMTGSDAFVPVQPLAWYVFAGADGQAWAHDEFLQGNDFRTSPHVTMHPAVGEVQVGLAVMYAGFRLSFTQVFQTEAFRGQRGGLHQFGSIALSARF